ncbi:hypothetical protein [Paenibacillus sacheonensis]|uniref:DUF4309 domain-containing protein n=1 Tax=Paenibacillus sacheonensis TaxID=742054 RepID=A0A7X4YT33_9BACL|nr:hypothetical protein [Paenibacillus sacheonensis]MBM7563667.1 hypothetical protein [Paenibacillus sacheonensis]NBC71039.1 hypothetical protein [Paenibacillus sacheonensis]
MKVVYAKHTIHAAAAALLVLSITGCQLNAIGISDSKADKDMASAQHASGGGDISDSPQKSYDTKDGGSVKPAKNLVEEGGSSDSPDATTESSAVTARKSPATTLESEDAWNEEAPRLLGIALGDSHAEAGIKLGKPADSYPIADGGDRLTVEEYAAFSVGYDGDQQVVFVDVFDHRAATGLSGLRVGDSGSAALKALGKPDTHTSSVLAYEADGALLKLDLDPQNDRIISIKLFSTDRQP